MCGRFGLTRPDQLRLERLGLLAPPIPGPRFNISPGEPVLAIREVDGQRAADWVRWGLTSRGSGGHDRPLVNLRSEGVFSRGAVRNAARLHRCLVPADVFYEWQAVPGARRKQPWAVALAGKRPFALGAVWDASPERGADDPSLAILTTEPNSLLAPIHDRMPVIVPPDHYADWLDARTAEPGVREMMMPWPADDMVAWLISSRVNRTEEEDAQLLDPVEPPPPAPELDLFET